MKNFIHIPLKAYKLAVVRLTFWILILFFGLNACNVTNNFYLNDPEPVGSGEFDGAIGIGTGMEPKIDSISDDGNIYFNNAYSYAPIVFFAGQIGLSERLDLRIAAHFPYAFGGFGGRVGIQYGVSQENSKLQFAIGSDFGFVFARDTLRLLGSSNALHTPSTGGMNLDFFLPVAYRFSDNFKVVVTPRYNFNGVFVRLNKNESKSKFYMPMIFGVSVGVKYKRLYGEYSSLYYKNTLIPNFGVAYTFSSKNTSSEPIYYTE